MWKPSPSIEPARAARAPDAPLEELCRRARGGERAAASQLLGALAPAMLRVARQILGNDSPDASDATQEAALAVLRALPGFRGECTLLHFACRIAVLTAMNARRRRQSELSKTRAYGALELGQQHATPEQLAHGERCMHAVRELLERLPPAQAEVLGLHHVVGMTAAEIAAATHSPLETVRSRLKLGREALRRQVLSDDRLKEVVDEEPR